MFQSKPARRFALIGVIGYALCLGGVAGCDSTPPPPTDASPPIPDQPGITRKGKFAVTKGKAVVPPPATK